MIEFLRPKITSKLDDSKKSGTVEIAPLHQGYALTIGNAIRRVLLNAIPGSAVTKIMLEGSNGLILHEFSVMPGVKEDVCEIVLNVKEIVAKMASTLTCDACIDVVGPCEVTDSMIKGDGLTIMNPDHHIATIEDGARFFMKLTFESGKGYASNQANRKRYDEEPIGTIFVDSRYTPIKHVGYTVENMRVDDCSDYEKLIFDVETTGVLNVEEVIAYATGVLAMHFAAFSELAPSYFDLSTMKGEEIDLSSVSLTKPVEELQLSIRSYHCLKRANINTVEDIVSKSIEEMMSLRALGQKSFTEIKDKIHELGLKFRDEE